VLLPQFQNFGHLTQTGAGGGTWTLSGAGTFTVGASVSSGTMIVASGATLNAPTVAVNSGGTLVVNGTTGATTVNAGGTLGGSGTVGSTTVTGNIAPGNSIGTLNVNGSLTFNSAGGYTAEVSPTTADLLNVSGSAALAGTLTAVATGGS